MKTFHPAADLFPLMDDESFAGLKADIKAHGQREPIWLHPDGSIIDGRNRYRAVTELNHRPKFSTWDGKGSLIEFVLSLNLHRRHLTTSQRAAIAAQMLPMLEAEAKERKAMGGRGEDVANLPHASKGKSRDIAGEKMGVSGRSVAEAKKLFEKSPEAFEQVKAGKTTINKARATDKSKESQQWEPQPAADEPPAEPKAANNPDSLENVQADIAILVDKLKEAHRLSIKTFDIKGGEINRPYCSRYTVTGLTKQLNSIVRYLKDWMPTGGEPGEPTVQRDDDVQRAGGNA